MMLQNYTWLKNPFSAQDKPVDLQKYYRKFINMIWVHIVANLLETTTCQVLVYYQREYSQLSEEAIKAILSNYVSVRTGFLHTL